MCQCDYSIRTIDCAIEALKKLQQIESVECGLPNRFCEGEGPFEDGYNRAIDECEPIIKKQALRIKELKNKLKESEL